jgi:hypothetical protein
MPLALTVSLVVFGVVALLAVAGYLIDKSADNDGIS